jgi:hypothetical protein
MEGEPRPLSRLEQLEEAIANSAASIELEFSRTANSWLSCFGSRVFVVETLLSSPKVEELLPVEKYQEALSKLELVKERLYQLKQIYPDKETVPPEEVKEELLQSLEII